MTKSNTLEEWNDKDYCIPLYIWTKEFSRLHQNYLKTIDLTFTQYIVMSVLWIHGDMLVKEIGKILRLDSGTLTPVLKKLEQKGFVIRQKSAKDARDKMILLTQGGRELKKQASAIRNRYVRDLDLDPEVIRKLIYHVKAASEIMIKEIKIYDLEENE